MNRVLITGGASGIGRHLAAGYAKAGYEVFVFDVLKGEFSESSIPQDALESLRTS